MEDNQPIDYSKPPKGLPPYLVSFWEGKYKECNERLQLSPEQNHRWTNLAVRVQLEGIICDLKALEPRD